MADKKKLLIFLGSLGRGGAEKVISLVSDYFVNQDWDVTIGLLLNFKIDYDINEKVKVIDLSYGGGSRIKRLPKWLGGVRKLVKDERPDVVLSFAARINVIVQAACVGLGKKVVVSERNDPYMDGRGFGVNLMTDFFYPKAAAVVFQTRRAEGYFKKLKLKNSTIIANPISVSCERGDANKYKIVTAGRLTPQKNHRLLISAFCRVAERYPDARLVIYGEGELRGELTDMVISLGLSDKVTLPGNMPNLHECISDAGMFVLSSDYEGLSNALCEAMMMGLPVISTNCAGSDEYIRDGENGLLVDVGDEDALVRAMCHMLGNEDEANRMAENAKLDSHIFKKEEVMKAWFDLLSYEGK